MEVIVKLYSSNKNEINRFLNCFFIEKFNMNIEFKESVSHQNSNLLEWQKKYQNPLEIVDIIGTFIENNDKFKINMWISLDKDIFINVTDNNVNELILYIYERYPW